VDPLAGTLQACLWARALSPAEFQRVLAGVVVRGFPAGSIVCGRGEPVNAWIGVVEGLVKLTTVSLSGKETTLMGVPAGGWFGEGSLLKRERRKHDVVALRESRVAFMRGTTFRWLIEHSLAFNRFLTMQLNERLGQFIGMVEYDRLLADVPEVIRPRVRDGVVHSWHLYAIRIDAERLSITRERFIEELRERGIGTSVHYIPIHFHPYFRETLGLKEGDYPVTERVFAGLVSLPLYPRMQDADVVRVSNAVREIVGEARR